MKSAGGRSLRRGVLATLAAISTTRAIRAQECSTTVTRTGLPSISGAYIRSVAVRTDAPVSLPVVGSGLASLRRRTETSIVQRQLLFAPGERADSARIAETLRRLRDQRLYADVALTVKRCTAGDTVDFTVSTVDAWTLRPIARVVPPSAVSIGFEDRNIFGTARLVSIAKEQTMQGRGGSVAATDPWLLGTDLIGAIRFSDVAGAHLLRASVRTHEHRVFDPWRVEAAYGRQSFTTSQALERPLRSAYLVADVGRLIDSSVDGATMAYAGAERDEGRVISVRGVFPSAPQERRRDFEGVDFSVQHRTARFDTVSWFAAGRGFLDIPSGIQADILTGVGKDRVQLATAMRYDAWAGRIWTPRRGQMFSMDVWTNGFFGKVRGNHIDRFVAGGFLEAPQGFWAARLQFEELLNLDPDLRSLSLAGIGADPSFAAVPTPMRLADRALSSNVERSFHLRPVARASMLDASLFAAASLRWDAPLARSDRLAVAVIGARLRLFSANGSFTSTRVDISYPVASNGSVVHRPLLSISVASLLDAPRQRDGRRRQQ